MTEETLTESGYRRVCILATRRCLSHTSTHLRALSLMHTNKVRRFRRTHLCRRSCCTSLTGSWKQKEGTHVRMAQVFSIWRMWHCVTCDITAPLAWCVLCVGLWISRCVLRFFCLERKICTCEQQTWPHVKVGSTFNENRWQQSLWRLWTSQIQFY